MKMDRRNWENQSKCSTLMSVSAERSFKWVLRSNAFFESFSTSKNLLSIHIPNVISISVLKTH